MPKNERVADMPNEVLEPQARDRDEWTGELAHEAVLKKSYEDRKKCFGKRLGQVDKEAFKQWFLTRFR